MLKVLILITLKTYKQSEFLKGGKYMFYFTKMDLKICINETFGDTRWKI